MLLVRSRMTNAISENTVSSSAQFHNAVTISVAAFFVVLLTYTPKRKVLSYCPILCMGRDLGQDYD